MNETTFLAETFVLTSSRLQFVQSLRSLLIIHEKKIVRKFFLGGRRPAMMTHTQKRFQRFSICNGGAVATRANIQTQPQCDENSAVSAI
jgi:hypothetical protein